MLWWRKALRNLWWLALAGALVLSLFGGALADRRDEQLSGSSGAVPSTLADRGQIWEQQYIPIISRHWLSGYGPDLPDVIEWRYTESSYLTLVLRGGLPLLALYGIWQWQVAKLARRQRGSPGTDGTVALTALTVTILLVPMNAIWPYVVNSGLAQPYWIVVGLVAASVATTADGERDAPPAAVGRPAPPGATLPAVR